MFKTIEGGADCEILSVIRFLNARNVLPSEIHHHHVVNTFLSFIFFTVSKSLTSVRMRKLHPDPLVGLCPALCHHKLHSLHTQHRIECLVRHFLFRAERTLAEGLDMQEV